MSELVSDYVKYAEKTGQHIERAVEICESADAVKEETKAINRKKSIQTGHTAGGPAGGRCYKLTAVCVLLLLYVPLLSAVTVLWIKYNNLNREKDQLQTSNNNLNIERDQLQTSLNKLKNEKNQLQFQKDQLLWHRDQLQLQRDQLVSQRDQLQNETSRLQNVLLKLGWRFFSENIYYINTAKRTWNDSKQDCITRGANLVTINSREEQEFISTHFNGTEAWIGLTDRVTEGEFKWVDDSPLTTAFWWNGEPNDYEQNEDCAITNYRHAKYNISTWADYPCLYAVAGICEMKIFN
ncbi:CD209 antigen-like protein C isoform X1 [Hemibagrus wyckioides]|uniref:CD209 antigen-like protein C isoform X1 n=1 Tax=Hemibagrus wyckioides TaxID=337641 RepID=UPI00266BD801|nr:CD209 antigen-like protein C isoform X1 [Hemibagrus wyckioides]